VPEWCVLLQQSCFPHNVFGLWKSVSLLKIWHQCWWTESTCLSASGTMLTITNTIIICIITLANIQMPFLLSALEWMCAHTATICRLQTADFARKYTSQDPISTCTGKSKIVIDNTINMTDCEILLWWAQWRYGSHLHIDRHYEFCHIMPLNTHFAPSASSCLMDATLHVSGLNTKRDKWEHIVKWN
jgi:hypothetical protein